MQTAIIPYINSSIIHCFFYYEKRTDKYEKRNKNLLHILIAPLSITYNFIVSLLLCKLIGCRII